MCEGGREVGRGDRIMTATIRWTTFPPSHHTDNRSRAFIYSPGSRSLPPSLPSLNPLSSPTPFTASPSLQPYQPLIRRLIKELAVSVSLTTRLCGSTIVRLRLRLVGQSGASTSRGRHHWPVNSKQPPKQKSGCHSSA